LPIVVSCPHVGTAIPPDLAAGMTAEALATPDTDWFVHDLYGFAPAMGITLIHARYSRFVIDLNRDPAGSRLYHDGRAETSLVPTRSFGLVPLYHGTVPDEAEVARRLRVYYEPYHAEVRRLLRELRNRHENVLFFDAHSIKRLVPSIRSEAFADVILGDQKGRSAAPALSEAALAALRDPARALLVAHNEPFIGGYLTRTMGEPPLGIHALQLEMSQDLYMDEAAARRDEAKERRVQEALVPLFERLAVTLEALQ
jgi:N-formylglutamate amidohydrolase